VASPTILLVDDDPDIRKIAALSLERIGGFRVCLAATADEALDRARRALPDLVLLDVSMPGRDGPSILAELRLDPATRAIPVVFFTATTRGEEVDRLLAMGAVAVVEKPFDVGALAGRVQDILARAGLD
jgi:two-component system, OmpR family, response regulator